MSAASENSDSPAGALDALLVRLGLGRLKEGSLQRLTGGANQQTWAFEATTGNRAVPLIMRRLSPNAARTDTTIDPEVEALLIKRAGECAVPTAGIRHVLEPADGLGKGFIAERVAGETLARRILRDAEFAAIRPRLAFQCGTILARIHAVPLAGLPPLRTQFAAALLDELYRTYECSGGGSAVFELAFAWLREHLPNAGGAPRLVHGDFRNGNLMVGADGVRAVLDWELAHLGDPAEDLGWITINSWRFGAIENPVGGFGTVEQMLEGYRSAGGAAIDVETVRYWRTMGSLRWGMICRTMARAPRRGMPLSVERAVIGRRASEAELDLLDILSPDGAA